MNMKLVLNPNNKFFTFMTKVADLIILNLLFLLCSLPIFTIGAALSSMYSVTMKQAKGDEPSVIKEFFKAMTVNFKSSTIIWVINLLVFIVIYFDLYFVEGILHSSLGDFLRISFLTLSLILFIISSYAFPMVAKFYNSTGNYLKNSFLMALKDLPYTFLIVFINLIPLAAFLIGSFILGFSIYLYLLIGFALSAYIKSFAFNKIFDKYI